MQNTLTVKVVVKNQKGIHGKPSRDIAEMVRKYSKHKVILRRLSNSQTVEQECNAENEMSIMMLSVRYNDTVEFSITGPKRSELADQLCAYISEKVYENECRNSIVNYIEKNKEAPELIAKLLIQSRSFDLKSWFSSTEGTTDIICEMQKILRGPGIYTDSAIAEFGNIINNYLHNG